MMRYLLLTLAFLTLYGVSGAAISSDPSRYRLTVLDDPKHKFTLEAHAINNGGVVVGVAIEKTITGSRPHWHAFLYRHGKYNEVGTLPGYVYSEAVSINDRNEIVGTSDATGRPRSGFVWRDGRLTRLPTVKGGGCSIYGINNVGDIVGSVVLPDGRVCAAEWRISAGGRVSGPTVFDKYDRMVAASNSGDLAAVIGEQSFLVNDGSDLRLGTLGGTDAVTTAMNDVGDVVGVSTTRTELTHAFLWQRGRIVDVSTIKSLDGTTPVLSADSINNTDQIVGAVRNGTDTCAMLFENGHATNLNHLVAPGLITLDLARWINDRGQILGQGHVGRRYVSYLLTPTTPQKPLRIVPESAFALTPPDYKPAGPPPGTVVVPKGGSGA